MRDRPATVVAGLLLIMAAETGVAQQPRPRADSARAQIRSVLRAFYLNLEKKNWDALSAYVLSPKLLERRGGPADSQVVARDRSRGRGSPHAMGDVSVSCSSSDSVAVERAAILIDEDWAEASVPRCRGAAVGVDEFRLLYFENRWRFIYTDLFQADTARVAPVHQQ